MSADPSTHGRLDATLLQAFADMERRLQAGEAWEADAFLADHPDFLSDPERVVDLLLHEYLLRRRLGEALDPQAWFQRFPRWEELLHRRLQTQQTVGGESAGLDRDAPTQDHTPAPASTPEGAIPELGRHELHEEIGRGGMGVVYRAHDLILNRPVALKMIVPRQGLLETPEAVQRFYREARAAARLRHPHIIPIHGMGLHQGRHCFTMPLLTGGSLAGRKGDLHQDARAAAALVEKIARAVQYAHEQGVIHRDLKPANILLDEHGEPVVADFGLAKVLDGDADGSIAGQRVGTPAYMSPEQAAGHTWEVSPRSDVWALGVILYELLTGKRPFPDPTPEGIYKQVLTGRPAAPRSHRGDLPPELEQIVLKCLQWDPAQRYAAAGELAQDLGRWLRGEPMGAAAGGAGRRSVGATRRRLLVAASLALTLVGAAAVLLWVFAGAHFPPWQMQSGGPPGPPPPDQDTQTDRPLHDLQARLRRGEMADLIRDKGRPDYFHPLAGEKDVQTLVEEDGTFAVSSWPLTLLKLLPDGCGHKHYLLHAEIRHLITQQHGAVGLCFAASVDRTGKAPVFSFLQASFNDLHSAVDDFDHLAPEVRAITLPPKGNEMEVKSNYCVLGETGMKPVYGGTFLTLGPFKPSGNMSRPGEWRTIEIEVSPERVRVSWPGAPSGSEISKDFVAEEVEKHDREQIQKLPANAAPAAFLPRLQLDGGIALYVEAGKASFRNVRITPLDGPSDNP